MYADEWRRLCVKLRKADETLDRERGRAIAEDLVKLVRSDGFVPPTELATHAIDQLRRQGLLAELFALTEALLQHGCDEPCIKRHYAQGLIEHGHLVAARDVLRRLLRELRSAVKRDKNVAKRNKRGSQRDEDVRKRNENELVEARGLLGRVWKQIYTDSVDAGLPKLDALQRGLEHYAGGYRRSNAVWHGVNVVALLHRARRHGVTLKTRLDGPAIAEKLLHDLTAKPLHNHWDAASAMDCAIALGRPRVALEWAGRFVAYARGDAFALGSSLRQLEQLWDLPRLAQRTPEYAGLLDLIRGELLRAHGGASVEIDPEDMEPDRLLASQLEARFSDDRDALVTYTWFRRAIEVCGFVGLVRNEFCTRFGTGFLIPGAQLSPRWSGQSLFVTNAHVISTRSGTRALSPEKARVEFSVGETKHRVAVVLWESPPERHDVTIARLSSEPRGHATPIEAASTCATIGEGQRAYVIGHPDEQLQLAAYDNMVLDHDIEHDEDPRPARIHYRSMTDKGSSGSPVFNALWELVAVHHAGSKRMPRLHGDGTYAANEGTWIGSVKAALRGASQTPANIGASPPLESGQSGPAAPATRASYASESGTPITDRNRPMTNAFERITLSAASRSDPRYREALAASPAHLESVDAGFANAEAAARHYLDAIVRADERPAFRTIDTDPRLESAGPPVPGLEMIDERSAGPSKTKLICFEQQSASIPVFGSGATVELDDDNNFVSASLAIADVTGIEMGARLDAGAAARALADHLRGSGVELMRLRLTEPRQTIIRHPRGETWHLTWRFSHVAAAPPANPESLPPDLIVAGCCQPESSMLPPDYEYFVDAASGEVVYFFSNTRRVEIPTWCHGVDEHGVNQTFFGRANGVGFELNNPFEDIQTFDMGLQPIETTLPPNAPVQNPTNDWQGQHPAAISAHVNATRVLDFLFRVLRRDSIDDHGLTVENIVNCTSVDAAHPPEWINAAWFGGKMWYGQEDLGNGQLRSISRFLDIIAHELTHGITEHTANLVYRDLPGALNESISDIFGVIISNWHLAADPSDVQTWSWEIGPGLGAGGAPLRNLADPPLVGAWYRPTVSGWVPVQGYPNHMSQHVVLPPNYDSGGVHIFSNIHNRAAHLVLTSTRADGTFVFTPEEVAVLYYLMLNRLTVLSDFRDARAELLAVVDTIAAGNPARLQEARMAVTTAYDAVGIV